MRRLHVCYVCSFWGNRRGRGERERAGPRVRKERSSLGAGQCIPAGQKHGDGVKLGRRYQYETEVAWASSGVKKKSGRYNGRGEEKMRPDAAGEESRVRRWKMEGSRRNPGANQVVGDTKRATGRRGGLGLCDMKWKDLGKASGRFWMTCCTMP
ncbi:hypothetical protein NDU88_004283 [Pleurodeles waltl]|uniref:Uncharacterized protein n=1 Tax=Pleurodeles waltl TaxID=8319 RepID=A0AAV7QEF4_PLEWA|nr:hypothetical protein NDU88_004283 [Pleurodeles waltl]